MMSNGSGDDIPGAPQWVRHFFNRVDQRFDTFSIDLELAVKEFRASSLKHAELEERVTKAEAELAETKAEVLELRRELRSLTPPGMPAISVPPDDAA